MGSDESLDIPDLDVFAAMFAVGGQFELEAVAKSCPEFLKLLQECHPVKVAATFGGLLTKKRLQVNCLRLETLVHLCLAKAQGSRAPTSQLLTQGYMAIGSFCGHLEDPPEDIFVGNIYSKHGNYRVLEGIWECGTFFLQRFVNLTDNLPNEGDFIRIADSIHSLLKVSDIVCKRAGLRRNELGGEYGESKLPKSLADKSNDLRHCVQISFYDLSEAGINIIDLQPFIFSPTGRSKLLKQSIGNTDLERHPLAIDDDQLYLLLPTAISVAIRHFFLRALGMGENRRILLSQLGLEYSSLFNETPVLGDNRGDVSFSHPSWGSLSCMSMRIDEGRYLNLIFFMDTLEDFEPDGFSGAYFGNERFQQELNKAIYSMQADRAKSKGFREGVTLLIGCGVGRGAMLLSERESHHNWEEVFLSASDFCTLSRTKDMNPLNLLRILQMKLRLKSMNVVLQNMNGFLNLYAWAESLDGHLVPHADIPKEITAQSLYLSIEQNGLIDLRHRVSVSNDSHVEKFIDGTWQLVFKEGNSYFEEDDYQPLYGHLPSNKDSKPLGAFITSNRCWWYDLASPADGPDTRSYDRWKMLGVWLPQAATHLEQAFSAKLGKDPILWRCIFEQPQGSIKVDAPGTVEDAIQSITTNVDILNRTIELKLGSNFDRAIYHQDNIAERALVAAFVRGVACLAGDQTIDIENLTNLIVPNTQARYSHMFPAKHFRDYMPSLLDNEPIAISRFDDAALKLGLGWNVHSRDDGDEIRGKEGCINFLNTLVQKLEDELCQEVKVFNRTDLLTKLLLNHEIASASRDRWHKTAAAVLALRNDKAATFNAMRDHEFKLNGIFLPSRNLIEMVICESLIVGGQVPGELDLSRLMAKTSLLFHLGGWSDLIRWDLLEPILIIRPLGDVHVKHDFMDTVLENFSSAASKYKYMASARNYSKNIEMPQVISNASDEVEAKFLSSWHEEFGVELDGYRRFLDAVEEHAIECEEPVIKMRHSELIALAETPEIGIKIVNNLTLFPRSSWRELPEGYSEKDIAPWRFRRRLSALRRPLFQITNEANPLILLAPGLLREGFIYMVNNYFHAAYPDWHLGASMRSYAGYARNRDGLRFNRKVSDQMSELGWQVKTEINVTAILGESFERNYGDVDVLAWDAISGRILIMECKDLQFRKTFGEIAEQLGDFRGVMSEDGKKRDLLRKHLDRLDILRNNVAKVKKFLGLEEGVIESHIVFKHPVPMQFADGPIRQHGKCHIFDELHSLSLH